MEITAHDLVKETRGIVVETKQKQQVKIQAAKDGRFVVTPEGGSALIEHFDDLELALFYAVTAINPVQTYKSKRK